MSQKNKLKPKCSYPEKSWMKFLLLRAIYEKPSYGYEIIKKIKKITDNRHQIKSGTAYTILRRMEEQKLLKSDWKKNEQGPNKRIYKVTSAGEEQLKNWLEVIIERKKMIDKMVDFYNNHFKDQK